MWAGVNWVGERRCTYSRDAEGNMISAVQENRNGTNWVNVGRITYTYGANNRMVSGFCEQWDGANWILGDGVFYFDNELISNSSGEKFEIFYASLTDIRNNEISKNNFVLSQNYPNPFNPTTKIQYTIPTVGVQRAVSVQLEIYNVLGKEVATLVNESKSAGNYEVEFDASSLPSGVYFYQLKVGNSIETKKMILMR